MLDEGTVEGVSHGIGAPLTRAQRQLVVRRVRDARQKAKAIDKANDRRRKETQSKDKKGDKKGKDKKRK